MRTWTLLLAVVPVLVGAPTASQAGDLEDFFPSFAARGVPVPVNATINYQGGGARRSFRTDGGFGAASANFSDVEALTTAGDLILGNQNLPIASSVSAFTFTFDPALNVFAPSTDSFGPIFSERAETTGKGKINIGFSFAYADFDIFEGERLSSVDLEVGGTRAYDRGNASFAVPGSATPSGSSWSIGGGVSGDGVAGGTLRQNFTNSNCSAGMSCSFSNRGFSGTGDGGSYDVIFDLVTPDVELDADVRAKLFNFSLNYGVTETVDVGIIVPYLDIDLRGSTRSIFPDGTVIRNSASDSARGVGDIQLRTKWHFYDQENWDLGARFDVILPTGREEDLLGFGDPGFAATFIASGSYGIFSPHANVGVLIRGGGKEQHSFRYTVGTDIKVTERLSVTTDLIGLDFIEEDGIGDFQLALGTGLKFNPWRRIVIAASALWKLNESGLRATVIPSVSLEYTF